MVSYMKIRLRISPVNLYLVTPSDKIISIMEMEFMVYNLVFIMKMTVYCIWLVLPKGRASAISFYGWDFEWTSWIWNIRFVMNHSWCLYSRNQTSPKPIIYVDIWIYDCWSTVNLITIHTPLSGQPSITALPRITADYQHNINIEQPLLLTLKPRLI